MIPSLPPGDLHVSNMRSPFRPAHLGGWQVPAWRDSDKDPNRLRSCVLTPEKGFQNAPNGFNKGVNEFQNVLEVKLLVFPFANWRLKALFLQPHCSSFVISRLPPQNKRRKQQQERPPTPKPTQTSTQRLYPPHGTPTPRSSPTRIPLPSARKPPRGARPLRWPSWRWSSSAAASRKVSATFSATQSTWEPRRPTARP